jgi:IS4 transposase
MSHTTIADVTRTFQQRPGRAAREIADLYKRRWAIKLFSGWVLKRRNPPLEETVRNTVKSFSGVWAVEIL